MFYIPGAARGIDKLWIIGDDFVSRNLQQYYLDTKPDSSYVRNNFEVSGFYNNSFALNRSVSSRIQNAVVTAFNQQNLLPKIIVIILEDNLINNITKEESIEVTNLVYTRVIKNLAVKIRRLIAEFKEKLPPKANRASWPKVIWITPVTHDDMRKSEKKRRRMFTEAMRQEIECQDNMVALDLKQIWDPADSTLYQGTTRRFTADGLKKYWIAVDRTIKFGETKYFRMKEVIKCPYCAERIDVNEADQLQHCFHGPPRNQRRMHYNHPQQQHQQRYNNYNKYHYRKQ